jgi:hypothetical protein
MDGEEFDRLTEEPELYCGLTEQDLTFAVATLGVKVGLGASGFGSLGDPSYRGAWVSTILTNMAIRAWPGLNWAIFRTCR